MKKKLACLIVSVAALLLVGCGLKGPLVMPPVQTSSPQTAQPVLEESDGMDLSDEVEQGTGDSSSNNL